MSQEHTEHTVEEIIAKMPVAQEVCDEEGKCEPDAVYISDVRKALIALHHSHTEQIEQARREERERIKTVIKTMTYDFTSPVDTRIAAAFHLAFKRLKKVVIKAVDGTKKNGHIEIFEEIPLTPTIST